MVAAIRLDRVPAITALTPIRAMSPRRLGAKLPKPPSRIAIEERFAKPHRAKEMIALVFSDRTTGAASVKVRRKLRVSNEFVSNGF